MILHKLKHRANEGLIHSAKNKTKTKQNKNKKQKKTKKQKGFDCCATLYLEL